MKKKDWGEGVQINSTKGVEILLLSRDAAMAIPTSRKSSLSPYFGNIAIALISSSRPILGAIIWRFCMLLPHGRAAAASAAVVAAEAAAAHGGCL